MTTAITIDEFRHKTDEIIDAVIESDEIVIVTLADGRKFVLVPDQEWRSLDETGYLLSTEANRDAIKRSLLEQHLGKTIEVDI